MNSDLSRRCWLATLILTCVAALAGAGCGGGTGDSSLTSSAGEHQVGGTLRLSQGSEVTNLNPIEGVDGFSVNVITQINEPLFREAKDGDVQPWLVETVKTSKGDRVWKLKLRQGVEFSDGKPMTASDVLFTLETARKSVLWESLLSGIEKVSAPNSSTIVITNAKPAPELGIILSQWSFGVVPKGLGGETAKEFSQDPIGTGPFMLGPWKHGESLTLVKNPHYWKSGLPYLDRVVFQTVPSPESRVSILKGGQLDAIVAPPFSQLSSIEQTPGLTVGTYAMGTVETLLLNSRIPLFKNPKAREAVDYAVDRKGLVNATLLGHGEPAGTWIPPWVPGSDQSISPTVQNVQKAKALLSEAVEEGVDPKVTMLSLSGDPYWETAAQIVQQNLSAIGLEVEIKSQESASWLEELESGSFELGVWEGYTTTPSPSELFSYFNSTEGLFAGSDISEMTALENQATTEPNATAREHLWTQMQEMVKNERYVLPLTYSPLIWALSEKVSGFSVTNSGAMRLSETAISE